MPIANFPEERCVMCGAVIPEGRQVCCLCEERILRPGALRKPDQPGNLQPSRPSPG